MKSFADKLRECISSTKGVDTVILAKALDVSQSSVSQWQLGQKTPSKNNMIKLANFFRVPIEYFFNDDLEIMPNQNSILKKDNDDTIYVPFFKDGSVSAGKGNEIADLGDCDFLPFKPQDLRLMFGVSPNAKLGIIPCFGNSMEPTIAESSLVVFQFVSDIIEGSVYVCRYDNELFVKRIKKRPKLSLISDNKEYEPIEISEENEIQILGRVVGCYSIISKKI